jgi:hypothetical protein
MKDFLLGIGINIGLAVSGFFGSLLLVGQQKGHSVKEQIVSILGGTMSANYLTPVVLETFGSDSESLQYGMAFVIGFGGLKVVEYFYCKWFNKKEDDVDNN